MSFIASKEVFDSDYADEFQFWFVVDKANPNIFILSPYDTVDLWFIFTNEKDAQHFANLIKEYAKPYKDKELMVVSDTKKKILSTIVLKTIQLGLVQRNEALKFFEHYKELLGKYYGF